MKYHSPRIRSARRTHVHPVEIHTPVSFGDRVADLMAARIGSWPFIIGQSLVLISWLVLNGVELIVRPWDPYPFILLNLTLSFQAAYTGPILLKSANRRAAIDRDHAENAYHHVDEVNEKQDKQLGILVRQDDVMVQQHEEILAEVAQLREEVRAWRDSLG